MKTQHKITVLQQIQQQLAESYKSYKISEGQSLIAESTLSKLIGDAPSGQYLVRWMHARHRLSNVADWVTQPFNERVMWKLFKNYPDNFMIISGSRGIAGIKPNEADLKRGEERARNDPKKKGMYDPSTDTSIRYQIVAFRDGEQIDPNLIRSPEDVERDVDPTVMKARGGLIGKKDTRNEFNIFDSLADQIGKLQAIYISRSRISDVPKKQVKGFVKGYSPDSTPVSKHTRGGIEREKIDIRKSYQEKTGRADIVLKISNRLFKLAPSVLLVMPRRLRKAGKDPALSQRLEMANNDINNRDFKQYWTFAVSQAYDKLSVEDPVIKKAIEDFKTSNPGYRGSDDSVLDKLALQGQTYITGLILRDIKDQLAHWFSQG